MTRPTGHTVKRSGITKPVVSVSYTNGVRQRSRLTAGKQRTRRALADATRRALIASLGFEERDAVQEMDIDAGIGGQDVDAVQFILPPGEEGLGVSDDEDQDDEFEELLSKVEARRAYDPRTRRDRTELSTHYWSEQIEMLTTAYLDFYHRTPSRIPSSLLHVEATPGVIEIWDISTYTIASVPLQDGHTYINETLISFGYLASAPVRPTVAFSLRLFEVYRQAHRACPRLSIEAFCRCLCNLANLPFPPYLAVQLYNAYDSYLHINRIIDRRVDIALGRDTPNWHVKNSCPACFYTLDSDPDLLFSALVSMDGNNSLRRIGASVHGPGRVDRMDTRTIDSDWWIPPEEVNQFKDEVQSSTSHKNIPMDDQHPEWVDETKRNEFVGKCRERWHNAGPEQRKRMFALFDETGIFIASCRHHVVLTGCDMIKSGKLYKYAFATVNRFLKIYEPRTGCAYDVGCELDGSLKRSPLLSKDAESRQFRLMCGAFHGYAHNRACQLDWHPLYIDGAGNFDDEGCEHIFSSSNDLARATRHATRFHRRQAIEEHFNFWNQDKYAALSTYLVNHYNEALKRVSSFTLELTKLNAELHLTAKDFEDDLAAERAYFTELQSKQTLQTSLENSYVQALHDLAIHTQAWDNARAQVNNIKSSVGVQQLLAAVNHARIVTDTAYERMDATLTLVKFLEESLKIEVRWHPKHTDYIRHQQENVATEFRKVAIELERLVVMRFSELAKLSIAGLGVSLRRQISKALVRRSEAIRKAIIRYNTQVARLNPPRDALTWTQVADSNFLGTFEVLKHVGLVNLHPWAQPARRSAGNAYFKVRRSLEEIVRLNVEIRRLCTFIADEEVTITQAIAVLETGNPSLASEVKRQWALRSRVNQQHLTRLNTLTTLSGFTGTLQAGKRRTDSSPTQAPASDATPPTSTRTPNAVIPSTTPNSTPNAVPMDSEMTNAMLGSTHNGQARYQHGDDERDWDFDDDVHEDTVDHLVDFFATL